MKIHPVWHAQWGITRQNLISLWMFNHLKFNLNFKRFCKHFYHFTNFLTDLATELNHLISSSIRLLTEQTCVYKMIYMQKAFLIALMFFFFLFTHSRAVTETGVISQDIYFSLFLSGGKDILCIILKKKCVQHF